MRELKRPKFMYRFDLIKLIENTLFKGLNLESVVFGNSMEPTAFDGDQILIGPIKSCDDLKPNRIVVILSPDNRHFVMHRIITIDFSKGELYEKGDNCTNGSLVSIDSVKGIVIRIRNKECY